MILKYKEGLLRAENKDWFLSFYKEEDIASDEEVDLINSLAIEVGIDKLYDYLEMDDDIILQREYVEDLIDYLKECKEQI